MTNASTLNPRTIFKGHGTENDFLIIFDEKGDLDLSAEKVALLCDRRKALGADGILRVIRAGHLGETLPAGVSDDMWFMDYRNADGSLAEMCGNGVRVFAHFIFLHGLVDSSEFPVATRGGVKHVRVHEADAYAARVSVDMGAPNILGESAGAVDDHELSGLGVDMGNPHLACVVPELKPEDLYSWRFQAASFDTVMFPEGVNLEVLTPLEDGRVYMRVLERGVGETRSCGTGTVAAATAALAAANKKHGTVEVRVPGGAVEVEINETTSILSGPSRIVARIEVAEGLL